MGLHPSQPISGGNVASARRIRAAGGRFDVWNFTNFPCVHNVFWHGGGGVGQGKPIGPEWMDRPLLALRGKIL
jgi:hypothetical protein